MLVGGAADVRGTAWHDNRAAGYGGAAYASSGSLQMHSGCNIHNNTAETQGGGAIALDAPPSSPSSSTAVQLVIRASRLVGNQAVFGAVAAVTSQSLFDFGAAIPGCGGEGVNVCEGNVARGGWGDLFATQPAKLVHDRGMWVPVADGPVLPVHDLQLGARRWW